MHGSLGFARASALAVVLLLLAAPVRAQLEWAQAFGSPQGEGLSVVAPDSAGGCIVAVYTKGDLFGPQGSGNDFGLARLAPDGSVLWSKQVGAPNAWGILNDMCSDGAGGVFVAGFSGNDFCGPSQGGSDDAWVQHYDGAGNLLWSAKIGSTLSETKIDVCPTAAGGVYVSGATRGSFGAPHAGLEDAFLARLAPDGSLEWVRQWGTSGNEAAIGSAEDGAGGAYVCGETTGSLGGPQQGVADGWLAHVDAAGNLLWLKQLGTDEWDLLRELAPDGSGGVLVAGYTDGTWPGESALNRTLLGRFDASGQELWTETYFDDDLNSKIEIAPDFQGGAYVTTIVSTNLAGSLGGPYDIFFFHVDESGNVDWMHQEGCSASDPSSSICAADAGGFFASGTFFASFMGMSHQGSGDAIVYRFGNGCVGSTNYCTPSASSIPGCQAFLYDDGPMTSFNPSKFRIRTTPIPGNNLGLCIFTNAGAASIPFGTLGGVLCVQPPFYRTPPVLTGGNQGTCSGVLTFPLSLLKSSSPIVTAGSEIRAQVWARDPANPDGFLLSDGLRFVVCP